MFTPTRYFVLSEMAHTTSAKAKSPLHQQKFKSINHEQVLVDNAVEDVVNRAWFESAISNVFPKQEFESAISNVFPKQEAHSDGDRWDRVDPESLDNEQWKSAEGGFLTTQHGYVEELLPQAIKLARMRERTEVLNACVLPYQVQKLCRRAGISAYQRNMRQTSSPDDEDTVSQALQKVCDLYLFNLCKEINRLCESLHKKIITEDILCEALKSFHLKLFGSCRARLQIARPMKHHLSETGGEHWRGAEAEIHHERNINAGPRLSFPHAPFMRLVRLYLAEQASFEHPLKASAGVIDCIQLSMESILIHILEKARFMVRRTTKNKACGSKPRATLYGRDIKTVLCILAGSHHILRGKLRMVGDPALSCQRLPSRDALRGNAHAKVRGKVKGKTPARAQALARAQKR